MGQRRLNLRGVRTLLADSDHFTRGLISQMLRSFESGPNAIFDSGVGAKAHLQLECPDLCIIEAALPDMESAELVRWIRRQTEGQLRFVPIIILSSYTQQRFVAKARDAGANLVLKKPVSPQTLFDHIGMVAKIPRAFIEASSYAGPDRRFRAVDAPGNKKQRESDNTGDAPADRKAATA